MKRFELKHLAPYLPYKAQIKGENTGVVTRLTSERLNLMTSMNTSLKPILRPLSELMHEDFHLKLKSWFKSESEVIISVYKNEKDFTVTASFSLMGEGFTDVIVNRGGIGETRYWIVENLLNSHYDVFGLIPKGLAIDINTLKA